ncbi:class I SAM-dependent RNA methyltransferase [Candidatus Neptunichlamydia sp. REUL1]|uniref:class I SAM-dependent RNA methyltransferase n=1 Tax=Candidatus Neptunichlamydia sp. REUL1 TaxID=3064277 RepID=UPI00292E65FF|nr:hypothetical protein [Candidatus Neptunochlamydia sp. REUL1]
MSKTSKLSTIDKIIFGGNGITRIDGCVTFVPFSAPGDQVLLKVTKKKKNYQIAQIEKIFQEGPGRRSPKCPHFEKCGGCQLQHLDYQTQLEAKKGFLQEALRIENIPINPSHSEWNYRSNLRLNLRKEGTGFKMGYIGICNHSLVEPTVCPLFSEDPKLFKDLKAGLASLSNRGVQSASLRIFNEGKGIILAFSFFPKLPEKLLSFSFAIGICYKSPRKEKHLGDTSLTKEVLGISTPFSPYGFMQNNLPLSEELYQTVVDWIGKKPQIVFDLYCGVGITSTLLKEKGHDVVGVEINRSLPACGSFKMHYGAVETILPTLKEKPDVIIVNPPRTGLSKEVRSLLDSPKILYISCMPSTLARDLEELSSRYIVKRVEGFDLFPQTTHVETVVMLEQKKSLAGDS